MQQMARERRKRLIDGEYPEEDSPKPVKLLCLGMCRTGTTSLLVALRKLGYNPMHFSLLISKQSDPHWKRLWIEAIERTFFKQESYGQKEFDILLGPYDVALDIPCAIFAEQLIAAYPDAKVLITKRPFNSWIASMRRTVYPLFQWPPLRIFRPFLSEHDRLTIRLLEMIFLVHSNNAYDDRAAERAYEDHYNRVRELVPPEKLLEFSAPYNWRELCQFLGKPIPHEEYPHRNDSRWFMEGLSGWRKSVVTRILKKLGLVALGTLLIWLICCFGLDWVIDLA